jgi:hypothetical protein
VSGNTVIINQGISDGASGQPNRDPSPVAPAVVADTVKRIIPSADADLIWRLIEDIRRARRHMEGAQAERLIDQLSDLFRRHKTQWPAELRREAITMLAEQERSRFLVAAARKEPYDISYLKSLLEELDNVTE